MSSTTELWYDINCADMWWLCSIRFAQADESASADSPALAKSLALLKVRPFPSLKHSFLTVSLLVPNTKKSVRKRLFNRIVCFPHECFKFGNIFFYYHAAALFNVIRQFPISHRLIRMRLSERFSKRREIYLNSSLGLLLAPSC